MRRPEVLVLGGGGTLGEAWLRSLLAGLEAGTGWDLRRCDAFVGMSAGSIVASVLAAGRRPEAAKGVVFGAPGAPEASVADVLASCAVPWVFRPVTIGGRARRGEATSGDERSEAGSTAALSANLDAAPAGRGTTVLCLNPTASPRLAADRPGAVRAFARAGASTEALLLRGRGARVRIVAPDAGSVEAMGRTCSTPAGAPPSRPPATATAAR